MEDAQALRPAVMVLPWDVPAHRRHEGDDDRRPHFSDYVRMVHWVRNAMALVPKSAQPLVGTTIRTVFAQPDTAGTREQWERVADGFRGRFDRVAQLMDESREDVLAYLGFPHAHWRQVWSTNPLEMASSQLTISTSLAA